MASSKRDQLLDMATELFFKHGCHTIGIDKLLAQAGVAKMTLYSHFKSKEDLILAAAERLHERSIEQMRGILSDPALEPAQRVHTLLDYLEQAVTSGEFAGCPFHNVAVQFGDPDHPIHRLSARHAGEIEAYLGEGLAAAGAQAPSELARQLMLLIEGAKVLVQMTGDRSYMAEACASGRRMLDQVPIH